MFAGHIGAALAIGRADRRTNVGAFVFAALLLDVLLWLFVLLGWESVSIPADYSSRHLAQFVFPYSHGLVGALAWSLLAAIAMYVGCARVAAPRLRSAVLVGVAVFSHWILDALVHSPGLPLAGADSMKAGLGLWEAMPVGLSVETLIIIAGLWLYLSGDSIPRGRKLALGVLALSILGFTIAGMTVAPPPPSIDVMAVSSLIIVLLVTAVAWWLGSARS